MGGHHAPLIPIKEWHGSNKNDHDVISCCANHSILGYGPKCYRPISCKAFQSGLSCCRGSGFFLIDFEHLFSLRIIYGRTLSRKRHVCDFSEKGGKRPKYLKICTKMYKIWKYLKKGQPHACVYHMHETARICPTWFTVLVWRFLWSYVHTPAHAHIHLWVENCTLGKILFTPCHTCKTGHCF